METTLHRQLKELYCPDIQFQEVTLGQYRIDAIQGDLLIEIQCASLGAIRDKIKTLLKKHDVLIVKPIAARTFLIKRKDNEILSQRYSPTKKTIYHLFDDLVHFVTVFPHPRLKLEIPIVELEEHRSPKKPKRWRRKDYRVEDRQLREVHEKISLRTKADLKKLLPKKLPKQFTTADLALHAEIPRWLAQKMAYCLREIGAIHLAGKQGNAILYSRVKARRAKTKLSKTKLSKTKLSKTKLSKTKLSKTKQPQTSPKKTASKKTTLTKGRVTKKVTGKAKVSRGKSRKLPKAA